MFIERLTKEQICKFFNTNKLSCFISKSYGDECEHMYVSVDRENCVSNYRMYDFEGSTCGKEYEWRKYLCSIFGEEYKNAYEDYLKEVMRNKLSMLEGA